MSEPLRRLRSLDDTPAATWIEVYPRDRLTAGGGGEPICRAGVQEFGTSGRRGPPVARSVRQAGGRPIATGLATGATNARRRPGPGPYTRRVHTWR